MSTEGDLIVGDCGGTVHIINVDADNRSFNTIQNAHAVRYSFSASHIVMFINDLFVIIIISQ